MTDEITRSVRKYMSELGKKGGQATLERHGRDHFVEMRKKSRGRTKADKPETEKN